MISSTVNNFQDNKMDSGNMCSKCYKKIYIGTICGKHNYNKHHCCPNQSFNCFAGNKQCGHIVCYNCYTDNKRKCKRLRCYQYSVCEICCESGYCSKYCQEKQEYENDTKKMVCNILKIGIILWCLQICFDAFFYTLANKITMF